MEDFAQAGGDWSKLGTFDPRGQLHRSQAFRDELPGEVDVGTIGEHHRDL